MVDELIQLSENPIKSPGSSWRSPALRESRAWPNEPGAQVVEWKSVGKSVGKRMKNRLEMMKSSKIQGKIMILDAHFQSFPDKSWGCHEIHGKII